MKKLMIAAAALLMMCAPAAQARPRGHRHKRGGKYATNQQIQELKAQQKAERQACKADPAGAGCADLKERQKLQRQELKQTLGGKKH